MKGESQRLWYNMRSERGINASTKNVNIELPHDAVVTRPPEQTHNTTETSALGTRTAPDNKSHLYFLALDLHGFLPEIHADCGFSLTGEGSAGEAEG